MKAQQQVSNTKNTLSKLIQSLRGNAGEPDASKQPNRYRIAFVPIVVLLLLGVIYFYFYSDNEGKKFDKKRYESLHTIERTIANKEAGYQELVDQISASEELSLSYKTNEKGISGPFLVDELKNESQWNDYFMLDARFGPKDSLGFYIRVSDYFDDLIPAAIFDNIVIIEKDSSGEKIKFQNLPSNLLIGTYASSKPSFLQRILTDSSGFLTTGNVKELVLEGTEYRVYTHVAKFNQATNKREIICGLVKSETYEAYKRKVNIWFIVVLSIILIITLVSLPLLKIYLINDLERIRSSDVVLTGMSVIIGAPLVLLVLLSIGEYGGYYNYEQPNDLRRLAKEIDSVFQGEINLIVEQLKNADLPPLSESGKTNYRKRSKLKFSDYDHFYEYYGIDETGNQRFSIVNYTTRKNLINLSKRQYFQQLNAGDFIDLSDANERYVVQSVKSWTTGKNEMVVGIPFEKAGAISEVKYLAMSTQPVSVINPIIPTGYGYAVIDREGNTLFHSNNARINTENLLREVENESKIQTAVFGNQTATALVQYWGKSERMHLQPSDNLPYYIVTFYDMSYAQSFIAMIASLCVVFIIAGFLLVGILIFATGLLGKRRHFFKFRQFIFDWLRPHEDLAKYYSLSIAHMSVTALTMIAFIFYFYGRELSIWILGPNIIAIGVLMPSLVYLSNYWLYNDYCQKTEDSPDGETSNKTLILITQLAVLSIYITILTIIVAQAYFLYFVVLWIIFFISTARATPLADNKQHWFYEEIVIFSYLTYFINRLSEELKKLRSGYFTYVNVWLLCTAFIPLIFIFSLTKSSEEILYAKYEMLKVAKSFESKWEQLEGDFGTGNNNIKKEKLFNYQFDSSSFYVDNIQVASLDSAVSMQEDQAPSAKWLRILQGIRPHYNREITESIAAIPARNFDGSWLWMNDLSDADGSLKLIYTFTDDGIKRLFPHGIQVTKDMGEDRAGIINGLGFTSRSPLFISAILISIALFLYLLVRIIRYLTMIIYPNHYKSYASKARHELVELWAQIANDRKVFVICNSSQTKELLLERVIEHMQLLDYLDFDELIEGIKHYSSLSDKRKARVVLALKSHHQIIISTRYPTMYLEEITESEFEEEVFTLISHYNQFVVSEYLNQENKFVTKVSPSDIDGFKDQKAKYHYYYDLWNSCSNREKYILYDLAEDGFVNTKNANSMLYLLSKGLIKWDSMRDRLELISQGFRTFIRTTIYSREGKKIEQEMSARGSWSMIRFILYGVLAAALVFIALGNPDFFSDFNTIITLVASVVTLFPLIGSLFSASDD